MSAEAPKGIGGYAIERELGHGALSVVYEASKNGKTFALKVPIRLTRSSRAAQVLQLRREASALARISHPHIVKVFAVGETDETDYLVMERISGGSLADALSDGIDSARLRTVLIELAEALHHIHSLGLVHRDVKPQNILFDETGSIRLIDFGFVTAANRERAGAIGTVLYASPEQAGALALPVDARSDLYSLGVVMFQALTGRLPFLASDSAQLVRKHATMRAPDVRSLAPHASPALSAIAAKLLEKDPDDRYQSGAALAFDLRRIELLDASLNAGQSVELGRGADDALQNKRSAVVGNAPVLETLAEELVVASGGAGRLAVVVGAVGSGKTTLLRAFAADARAQGALVLGGTHASATPFGWVRAALSDLAETLARLPDHRARTLQAAIVEAAVGSEAALGALCPALRAVLHVESQPMEPAPDAAPSSADNITLIAELLLQVARSAQGLVLVVDDGDSLDDASLRALRHLAPQLATAPLLIVSSQVTESPGAFVKALGVKERAISVAQMTRDDLRALTTAFLGGTQPSDELVEQVVAFASGSPTAAEDYLQALLEDGVVVPSWGTWSLDRARLERATLPANVMDLVARRVERLDPRTAVFLKRVALLGMEFSSRILQGVSPGDDVSMLIAVAQDAHLVRAGVAPGRFEFVHERARQALLAKLSETEASDLHQAIAEAVDDLPERVDDDVYLLAHHYAHGHPARRARRTFEVSVDAGRRLMGQGALDAAAECFEVARAHEANGSRGEQHIVAEALGDIYLQRGRARDATTEYLRAIELAETNVHRAAVRDRLSRLLSQSWDAEGAKSHFRGALRDLGVWAPRSTVLHMVVVLVQVLAAVFIAATGIGRGSASGTARERMRLLVSIYEGSGLSIGILGSEPEILFLSLSSTIYPALRVGAANELAVACGCIAFLFGLLRSAGPSEWFALRALAYAEKLSDRTARGKCLWLTGGAASEYGDSRLGEKRLAQALFSYGRWLDADTQRYARGFLMSGYLIRGYASEALLKVEQMNERDRIEHVAYTPHTLMSYGAPALAMQGRPDLAAQYLESGVEGTPATNKYGTGINAKNKVAMLYERGEFGRPLVEAMEEYRRVHLGAVALQGTHLQQANIYFAYGRLENCLAAPKEARPSLVDELKRAVREVRKCSFIPNTRCHLYVLQAALNWLTGDKEKLNFLLEKAQDDAARSGSELGFFELHRLRAHILMEDGHRREAEREATAAWQIAAEQGWFVRQRRVAKAFALETINAGSARSSVLDSTFAGSTARSSLRSTLTGSSMFGAGRNDAVTKALLKLSLASTAVFDADRQARVCLDEMVSILHAERAYLFLLSRGAKAVAFNVGRDAEKRDLAEPRGYSTTVVARVAETREAVVLAGTEEGASIGSQSAVANNLRSIIAAPLTIRGELAGVVYLDSSVARGVFTDESVEVLSALAGHIAIALETARSIEVELERRALQKDLAVSGAVQTLLLPRFETLALTGVFVTGTSRSAQQSGGDWWWCQELPDGSLLAVVADVTGHGVGSAMIASAVAGSFHSALRSVEAFGVDGVFAEVHRVLRTLCAGAYTVSAIGARINSDRSELTIWNAGHLPALINISPTETATLTAPGNTLGGDEYRIGVASRPLPPGSRILLCTDGLVEAAAPSGRQFGLKACARELQRTYGQPPIDTREQLLARLGDFVHGAPQDDDVTVVLACLQ